MKIAIVISGNLYKSHLSYYFNYLDSYNINYDIISWNRNMIFEEGVLAYNYPQRETKGYFFKLFSYLGYRSFALDYLNKNKYDKIIISTIPIAILLYPYLKKNYSNKYLFDIRDYSIIVKFTWSFFVKLIDNSSISVISSNGFKQWLPNSIKYIVTHNFPFGLTSGKVSFLPTVPKINNTTESIVISTIGSLRDFEANKILIDAFKSSNQIVFKFFGSGPAEETLKKYVFLNGISNVSFFGFYKKEDEANLVEHSHFINNFTNYDLNSRTLITNRLYLSVVLGIPMIVRHGTYQAQLCQIYNIGCVINPKDDIYIQLINYVKYFDFDLYNLGRSSFMEVVQKDTIKLDLMFKSFLEI